MRQEGRLPDAIANAPQLLPGLELYYEAFMHLHTDRHYHMGGPSNIPWTAIIRYAEFAQITSEDDIQQFVRYIRAMDEEYLDYWAKKNADK